ncbi:hypothetical protein VTK26DRAFT_1497 [Humicola hyalothermophila]
MVAGVPRMCMRQTVAPRRATVGSMSGSMAPPDTSLTMSAPAATAASATRARYVSTETSTGRRDASEGCVRISRTTGTTRASSSSRGTSGVCGAVDCPPTSIMVAPASRKDVMVSRRRVGSEAVVEEGSGRCWPPSEKESGVMLRMAMTWVLRDGLRAWMGGWSLERGVMVVRGVGEGGRAER